MKLLLVVLAIFGFAQLSNAQALPDLEELLACFERNIANGETQTDEVISFMEDLRATIVRLQEHRQRCIDIPRDDPPTALQERMIQICETTLQASIALELASFSARVRDVPELSDAFEDCINITVPAAYRRRVMKNIL